MAFATPTDLVARVDVRWLGLLVKDDGTLATQAEVLASTRVAAALESAAGFILAYALQGGRYTRAMLDALTGYSLALLKQLNCDLAAAIIAESRQVPLAEVEKSVPGYGRTMAFLEQLQLGNVIFDVDAAVDAGSPKLARNNPGYLVPNMTRYFGDVWQTERQNNRELPPPYPLD